MPNEPTPYTLPPTDNYDFILPEPGADADLWGNYLNLNWESVDAILAGLQTQITALTGGEAIPVNGIYLSTTSTNPATTLGYGSWIAYGGGRALVGVGNNGQSSWSGGETRGTETHALTANEMPPHTHGVDVTIDSAGTHAHFYDDTYTSTTNNNIESGAEFDSTATISKQTTPAGAHTHPTSVTENSVGGGVGHENVQPSIAVFVWRRTA